MDIQQMLDAASSGKLGGALYRRRDPLSPIPHSSGRAKEHVHCGGQDMFLTRIRCHGHVVLPFDNAYEKSGTFTNTYVICSC